jgi:hypothetical protein
LIPEFVEAKKNERTLKRMKIKHLKLNFNSIQSVVFIGLGFHGVTQLLGYIPLTFVLPKPMFSSFLYTVYFRKPS